MNIINEIKNEYEININNRFIHIINYIKIIDITYNNILINLYDRNVLINGNSLIIRKLDEKELIIDGNIKGIEFIEK